MCQGVAQAYGYWRSEVTLIPSPPHLFGLPPVPRGKWHQNFTFHNFKFHSTSTRTFHANLLHFLVADAGLLQLTGILHHGGRRAAAGGHNIPRQGTINTGLGTDGRAPQAVDPALGAFVQAVVKADSPISARAANEAKLLSDHVAGQTEGGLAIGGHHTVVDSQTSSTTEAVQKDGKVVEDAEQASGERHDAEVEKALPEWLRVQVWQEERVPNSQKASNSDL